MPEHIEQMTAAPGETRDVWRGDQGDAPKLVIEYFLAGPPLSDESARPSPRPPCVVAGAMPRFSHVERDGKRFIEIALDDVVIRNVWRTI